MRKQATPRASHEEGLREYFRRLQPARPRLLGVNPHFPGGLDVYFGQPRRLTYF